MTYVESVPMILSLIAAGREEIAVKQITTMARRADLLGKDLEIVVLAGEIMLIAVGEAEPIDTKTDIPLDQMDLEIHKWELAYPSAITVFP